MGVIDESNSFRSDRCSAAGSDSVNGYGAVDARSLKTPCARGAAQGITATEHHELPVADFILAVGSGGTVDPAPKVGLANLTAAMLTEGTTSRSSLEIADQIAYLGIGLGASSNWDASIVTLHIANNKAPLTISSRIGRSVVLSPIRRAGSATASRGWARSGSFVLVRYRE